MEINLNTNKEAKADEKIIIEELQGQVYSSATKGKIGNKHYYIESYGCAMNFSDSEIVASILNKEGYTHTESMDKADLILVNTCSIRDKAERTIRTRLLEFKKQKLKRKGTLIGILGCMAERLKSKFLEEERLVDLVVGPDAYRSLPTLIADAKLGEQAINVLLSREETYADIAPVRLTSNGISAYISIMRGCNNVCSFCVVPFTRGRERSRNAFSILSEVHQLVDEGFKEVTLLGQNVDSYNWTNPESNENVNFAQLLEMVAEVDNTMRIRFSTSHPKDITDEVLYAMKRHENICKYIHLPAQSGNSRLLKLMNRTYTREWYLERVDTIRRIMPDCAISSDFIAGFCTETEEDHKETLSLIEYSKYNFSYMYFYSERPGTLAGRKLEDDVPDKIKKRRLSEIIEIQAKVSLEYNKSEIGKTRKILIEGYSRRSDKDFHGRTSQNVRTIFEVKEGYNFGDYVNVKITEVTSKTLRGVIVSE